MTYCVAVQLEKGQVYISDTRTNAGVDHISTYRKLFTFTVPDERVIMIQTAGNLATTQAVMAKLQQQIDENREPNLYTVASMFEVAEIVGQCVREVIAYNNKGNEQKTLYSCSIILGGQIKGSSMALYHIYKEGNFIRATEETPYFQIGESKYGKPIMDRALNYYTPLTQALRCMLISFDSTIRSNVSVGIPLDVIVYQADSLVLPKGKRVSKHDPYFQSISQQWSETLRQGLLDLPEPTEDYFV